MQQKFIITKQKIILAVVLLLVSLCLWFLYSYSFIEITVSGGTIGQVNYELAREGGEAKLLSSQTNSAKKLVRRGSYEVMTRAGNLSHYTITSVGGFLSTTSISADLKPEKHREFIGNSPLPCMSIVGSRLVSYGCGDQVSKAFLHVPATSMLPTYTKPIESAVGGNVEGIVSQNDKTYMIIKAPLTAHEQPPHAAYLLSDEAAPGKFTELKNLDESNTYSFLPYKSGFVATSVTMDEVYYFSSLDAEPQEIVASYSGDEKTYRPYDVTASGNLFAIAYTEEDYKETSTEGESGAISSKSVVSIINGNQKTAFSFDKTYTDIQLCGSQKLCLLADHKLSVYDVSGSKQKFLYSMYGVNSFGSNSTHIIAARDKEIIRLDVNSRDGLIDYSYGNYTYCGMHLDRGEYVVCATNTRGESVALQITNTGGPNTIDKQVSDLLKLPEVKTVSAYRDMIFISPNIGPYAYNEETNSFSYDSAKRQHASKTIDEAVKKAGIKPPYKIVNPLR